MSLVNVSLNPERVARILGSILAILMLGHGVALLMTYGFDHDYVFGLVPLFNIAMEHNIPTLFATLLLFGSGVCFFVLYRIGDTSRHVRYVWLLLSLVFCGLAVDEAVLIHERMIGPVRDRLDLGGYLFFAWVVPYSLGVAVLACLVALPIWRLGWRYRMLFGIAGMTYLGGAIGVEMLSAHYYETNREQVDLYYRLFQTAEEFLEFAGLIVLVYTLLDLIRNRSGAVMLRVS